MGPQRIYFNIEKRLVSFWNIRGIFLYYLKNITRPDTKDEQTVLDEAVHRELLARELREPSDTPAFFLKTRALQ